MAKERGDGGYATKPGKFEKRTTDGAFHESEAGVLFAPEGFSHDAGLGTPPTPGVRGNAPPLGGSERISPGGSDRKSGVLTSFFMEKGGK